MSEMSVSLTTLSILPVPQCIRLLNFGRSRCRKWGFIECCHYSYTLLSTVSHNHITLLQIVKKCSRGRSNLFEVTNPWSNYWLRLLWCFLWLAWFMIILIILVQSHQCGMITCETKLCLNTGENKKLFFKICNLLYGRGGFLGFLKPPVIYIVLFALYLQSCSAKMKFFVMLNVKEKFHFFRAWL